MKQAYLIDRFCPSVAFLRGLVRPRLGAVDISPVDSSIAFATKLDGSKEQTHQFYCCSYCM